MRPGQQNNNNNNKRMRGRGRKGPNPMSRSYESNGPDVKIRGTAQHIAEKYAALARDATSAGDRVMAENYFQHSEHYGRIVAAAQGSFQPAQIERDDEDEDGDGEGYEAFANGQQPQQHNGQDRQDRGQDRGQDRQNQPREQHGRDRQDFDRNRGENGHRDQGRDGGNRDNGRDGANRDNGRDSGNRDNGRDGGQRDQGRDGGQRGDRNRDRREFRDRNVNGRDRRDAPNGDGSQPYAGEADGQRSDENRRVRNRDRGERRFDDSESAEADDFAETPAPVERAAAESEGADAAPAKRRPGRPRRQPLGETTAEVPSASTESPATVSAEGAEAIDAEAPAKRRPGRPRKVAAVEDAPAPAPAAEAEGDAPVKRRPGRPRKKPAEDEGSPDAESTLPAFLLASNN